LLSLFPDAKFIHIARNPFEVFASTRRFWEVIKKNYALGRLRNVNTDQLILDSYARIMQQYMEQRILIPENNLVEINYETFISEPVQTMKCIYAGLQLNDFEKCRTAMTNFAKQQKTYPLLQHRLEEETEKNISKQWAPYINSWSEKNKAVTAIHTTYTISEMDLHR
jgi:omega-hydroxy-beta-dihydromenaquinone-9 sulfotransferase